VWDLIVDVGRDPVTNRRIRTSSRFHGGKREAVRELGRKVAQAERGETVMTFGFLLDAWLEQADLSPTTRREYGRLIERRIRPALGAVPLRKLNARHLDEFYRALQEE
jgi:hypothetical protein